MVNAQEWLESQEEYSTKEKRAEAKKLDISNQNLEGELNFKELGFNSLEKIDISYNSFEKIDFSGLESDSLIFLNIENRHGRPKQQWKFDLSSLSGFHNLKELYVANAQVTGKVKDLKNMEQLECFSYGDNDIIDGKSGNENLDDNQFPSSVKTIYWGNKNSPSATRYIKKREK